MISADLFEAVVFRILEIAGDRERFEIPDGQVFSFIMDAVTDREEALVAWEEICERLRQWNIRGARAIRWDFITNVVRIRSLPTAEELQGAADLYELATPLDLQQRVSSLSGFEFEHFLGAILGRLPQFRNVVVTQASRDGGVDFKGIYVPEHGAPHFALVGQAALIGQAKQTAAPLPVKDARDFIGALDTASERRVVGLLVSTGGFTEPALDTLRRSKYFIMTWDLRNLLDISRSATTRRIDVSFTMPDETFWDELLGRAQTS